MLNKIKEILHNEKLLWKAERQPTKKDKIFGYFLFIPFCLSLYFLLFCLNEFSTYMEKFPVYVQLLSAAAIIIIPILLCGSSIIHILGDEKN